VDQESCLNVVVSGLVQGVCYRAFVQEQARLLGLRGWVKNLPDGCVEAEIEGEEAVIETLVTQMRKGPAMAHVTDLRMIKLPFQNQYTDFRVRYQ
jgi:acylphosphatase